MVVGRTSVEEVFQHHRERLTCLWAQNGANKGEWQPLVTECTTTCIGRDADVTISCLIDTKFVGQITDAFGVELWAGSLIYGFDGVFG